MEETIEEGIAGLWAAYEANSGPFATMVAVRSEQLDEGSTAFEAALEPAPDDECALILKELTPTRPSAANAAALHAALQRLQAQKAAPAPIAEEHAPLVSATDPNTPATDAPMPSPGLPDPEGAAQISQPEEMVTEQPVNDEAAQPEATDAEQPGVDLHAGDDCAVAAERAGPVDEAITTQMDAEQAVEAAQPEATIDEAAVATVPARARTRGVKKKKPPQLSKCYKEKPVKWKKCSQLEEAISANIEVELVDLRILTPDHTTKTGKRNKKVTIDEARTLTYAQLTDKQTLEARFKQRSVLAGGTREMNRVWQRVGDLMVAAKKLSPAYHGEMTDQGLGHLLDRPKRK
jgi:hypothetical protein